MLDNGRGRFEGRGAEEMTDLEIIREIEKKIGRPISRKGLDELEKKPYDGPAFALNEKSDELTDISVFKELQGLTALYLGGNQLTNISALKELRGLTTLLLNGNQLTNISALKELRGLTVLFLMGNQLTDISALKELRGLTSLDLAYSRLSTVSFVLDLPNLHRLNLVVSELADLPEHLHRAEIDDIRSFYRQKAKKTDRLYEAKVLFVGEPEAGKTSLMKKLIDPSYKVDPDNPEHSTTGITVHMNWSFKQGDIEYKAHFWDFGGQQIQYYIHQFFLSEQALYILLVDDRKECPNIDYWFRIIKLLGRGSKVLVLLNRKNIKGATGFDWNTYYNRYRDQLVLDFETIDLANPGDDFARLVSKVEKMIASLEHMGSELPASWLQIRKEVTALKEKNYISVESCNAICEKHGVVDDVDQTAIRNHLHNLGALLFFRNDKALSDIVFVNAQWIANAAYAVLADEDIKSRQGRFNESLLFEKWGDTYTKTEKGKLFLLMQKKEFDLVYPAQEEAGADPGYIVPLLLPDVAPAAATQWERKGTLSFQYRYSFMPVGIITRLIVRLSQWISEAQAGEAVVWKSGVILEKDGCLALVKSDLSKQGLNLVDISIKGDSQSAKDFLSYIRGTIDEVHDRFFKGVDVERLVPCNCELCGGDADPYMFELSRIQKYVEEGESSIRCEKGKGFRNVPIASLLGEIFQSPTRFDSVDSVFRRGAGEPFLYELLWRLKEVESAVKSQPQPAAVQTQQDIVQPTPPAEETTSPTIKTGIATWKVFAAIVTVVGTIIGIGVGIKTLFFPDNPKTSATTQQTEAISEKPAHPSDKPGKPERDTKRK